MLELDFSQYQSDTWLRNWWKAVKGNFEAVRDAVNANETSITTEAAARQRADTELQSNINAEAAARQQADTELQSNINTEAAARETADDTLNITKKTCYNYGTYHVETGKADNDFMDVTTGVPEVGDIVEFTVNADCNEVALPFDLYGPGLTPKIYIEYGFQANHKYVCAMTKKYVIESHQVGPRTVYELVSDAEGKVLYDNGQLIETIERQAADDAINRRIDNISLTKSLTFTSRSLPAPYVVRPAQEEDTAIDINLSGMFTINGRSCGTMNTATAGTSFAPNKKYIVVSFNFATEEITVTSSDSYVETSIANDTWTFTLANYVVSVVWDDDYDSPNYGQYKITSSQYDWNIPITGSPEYGYITAEYDPVAELKSEIGAETAARQTADTALQDEISEISSPNIRYVHCTGENDQVAIQAALDELTSTGGTVYVCGKKCGLSAEGVTQKSDIPLYTSWIAVLKIPSRVTLDFTACSGIEWKLGTPEAAATAVMLFSMKSGSTVVGAHIDDADTAESTATILDAFFVTESKCTLRDIRFDSVLVSNNIYGYKFILGADNVVDGLCISSVYDMTGGSQFIKTSSNCLIHNVKIYNYDASAGTNETKLMTLGSYNKTAFCVFDNVDTDASVVIELGNDNLFTDNNFNSNCGLVFSVANRCRFSNNVFYRHELNDWQMMVSMSGNGCFNGNTMYAVTIGEGSTIVDARNSRCKVNDNAIMINKPLVAAESSETSDIILIGTSGQANNNTIILPSSTQRASAPNYNIRCFSGQAADAFMTGNTIVNLGANDTGFDTTAGGIVHGNVVDAVYTA